MDIIFRTIIGFSVLLFLTRVIGKKQLGQLSIFTYITGIVIGNLAGGMIIQENIPISDGIIAMAIWSVLVYFVEYVSIKSSKIRVLLDGDPTIVIKKGQIMIEQLRKLRLNMDDLSMLLRSNNIFSILDVEYAIMEPNGELSVLKTPNKEQVIRQDLKINASSIQYLQSEIISDGNIVHKNLKELGISYDWVIEQLHKNNIKLVEDVFYAELQSDGSLYIQRK